MARGWKVVALALLLSTVLGVVGAILSTGPDRELRNVLAEQGVTPVLPPAPQDPARVKLGRALFFDPILSGNRDVSCSTCHDPEHGFADGLPLSVGTGGKGRGPERQVGKNRRLIGRHSPSLLNRGHPGWVTMFWDGRLEGVGPEFKTPLTIPPGLDNILAAQAIFPITNRDEMRGHPGDKDNELAGLDSTKEAPKLWYALMQRILAVEEYRVLLRAAYPHVRADMFSIHHVLNAIAAYEIEITSLSDTPFDRYMLGDDAAMSPEAKRGAHLFFGKAACYDCHSGPLLTDQRFHNLAVPQIGPGSDCKRCHGPRHVDTPEAGGIPLGDEDMGRYGVTRENRDRFVFRTPPLRNVELSPPYMHDGVFPTLEAAIRHHQNPRESLPKRLKELKEKPPEGVDMAVDPERQQAMLKTLDPLVVEPATLTDEEMQDLVAFMRALTDRRAYTVEKVPEKVPSGLPVVAQ